MKKFGLVLALLAAGLFVSAQKPVHWTFTVKKVSDRVYEVHLTALVDQPWHIYSQLMGEGGPVPTTIEYTKNPLLTIEGKAKEEGNIEQKHEDVFGMDVLYFEGKVDFVQRVTLKSKAKTNLSGKVRFMVCTDKQCLPPETEPFSLEL